MTLRMAFIGVFAVASMLASAPFHSEARSEEPDQEKADRIVKLLKGLPSWPTILGIGKNDDALRKSRESALQDAAAIKKSMEEIDRHETATIRTAVKALSQDRDFDELKLIWLNRYLFDIPPTADYRSPHLGKLLTGGSSTAPNGETDVLWPWKDVAGDLQFQVATHVIIYNGPPYRGLEVFDYYDLHFGRRRVFGVEE